MYLVGFMGSGKTSVGRCLARRLERRFVDLDESIENRVGVSIREFFSSRGETEFRRVETMELDQTTTQSDLVVATGGGAFSSGENQRLIHQSGGVSVFLDPPWDVIRQRLDGAQKERPNWVDEEHALELYEGRLPDYRRASTRVELDGGETPDQITDRIASALRETMCVS